MSQLVRFTDKVVIVTGAASGIGQAVLVRLVSEGAIAVGVDVNEAGLQDSVAQAAASAAAGGRASYHIASVADEAQVKAMVAAVVEAEGRLDVLVNMAGILRSAHLLQTSLEQFMEVLNVNLVSTFLCCREAMPHLLTTRGAIVNAASTSAFFGHPYMVAYAASKAGIGALTTALAWEYLHAGVRVNAVAPGGILTPMVMEQAGRMGDLDMSLFQHLSRPDVKLGSPAHVAAVVAMLASDDGGWMTGEIVRIDGGTHS